MILDGEARQQEGQQEGPSRHGYRVPHVDRQGRIHLYRYFGNYFEALSHEMVHAIRMQTNHWKDGFFEEGFASLIGDALQPAKKGFPLYGFPLTVVAGHWIVSAEDIPLMILKQQHRQLSLKCMAQSYSLRASFFKYLQNQFGDEPLLDLAYDEEPATYQRYEVVFGKPFDMLGAAWRADLLKRFRAFEQGAQLAQKYRANTPVQNWPICRAGKDY